MSYSSNPNIKARDEAFESGALFFSAAADAIAPQIEEQRADNGHALVNLRTLERAELSGLNFKDKPAEATGSARVRESNGELEKWKKNVADGKAALKEKQQKQNGHYAQAANYAVPRKLLRSYLLKLTPGTELLFDNRKAIKRKQETDTETLVRLESEITDAFELRKKKSRTPKTIEEAKALWRAQVASYVKKGEPDWAALFAAKGTTARIVSQFVDGDGRPDSFLFNAWVSEQALIEKGERAIEEYAALEVGETLTADARQSAIEDADALIYEKSLEYESLWFSLAKSGVFVPRRKLIVNDSRPLAGLSSEMPKIEIKHV